MAQDRKDAGAPAQPGEVAVEVLGLHKWYGEFHVLRDINLKVARGERIVICGPSGGGKSTLLRCINRLEDWQRGRIIVDGLELTEDPKRILEVRRDVGMVFQQFNLFPHLTVLFMASVMLPLFVPDRLAPDKLVRALVGVAMFASAYMAEVVRGGLLAVPRGQYEAARALGFPYWRMTGLVILPQALRVTLPNIVNTFIGLFKDTTLVFIVGIFDFLRTIEAARADPHWAAPTTPITGYAFAAVFYFVCCYGMSRYARSVEARLARSGRR